MCTSLLTPKKAPSDRQLSMWHYRSHRTKPAHNGQQGSAGIERNRTGAVNNKDSAIWRRPEHSVKKKQGKQGQKGGSRKAKRAGWKEKPTAHNAFECGAMEQKMSRRQRHLLKATPFHGLSSSSLGTTRLHSTHPQAYTHTHTNTHTHIPKHTQTHAGALEQQRVRSIIGILPVNSHTKGGGPEENENNTTSF